MMRTTRRIWGSACKIKPNHVPVVNSEVEFFSLSTKVLLFKGIISWVVKNPYKVNQVIFLKLIFPSRIVSCDNEID